MISYNVRCCKCSHMFLLMALSVILRVGVKDGWGKGRECSNCLSFLKKMTLHDINGTVVLILSGVTMGSGAQGGAKYLDCAPLPEKSQTFFPPSENKNRYLSFKISHDLF